MIIRKKILTVILLAAVFIAFGGFEFFHNHSHNDGDEGKCFVCVMSSVLHSADNSSTVESISSYFNSEYSYYSYNSDSDSGNLTSLLSDRAPPAF